MKIPNTNITCKFLYQQYKRNIKIIDYTEAGVITKNGELIRYCELNKLRRAQSIVEVPYWRLYVVKFEKQPHGSYKRTIVYKSVYNHDFTKICDLIRRIGNPNNNYLRIHGVYYSYECWPRRTRNNRTIL